MKINILKLICCTLIVCAISCSSDNTENLLNSENISLDDPNPMYLKKYINDVPGSIAYSEGIFEFNNGFLISGIGLCWFSGNYQYDNSGKLLSSQKNGDSYTYQYDNQNRLVKQSKVGSSDYISLSYNGNVITVTNSYSNFSSTPFVEISEIYTDTLGRIIKTKRITPSTTSGSLVEEYVYDARNNIIQKTYKESNTTPPQSDYSINYQYDDKKNPFYYAYKKIYKNLYYLQNRTGIANGIITGVTPNNLTAYGNSTTFTYTYNNAGYPIKIIQTYDNGLPTLSTFERVIEY